MAGKRLSHEDYDQYFVAGGRYFVNNELYGYYGFARNLGTVLVLDLPFLNHFPELYACLKSTPFDMSSDIYSDGDAVKATGIILYKMDSHYYIMNGSSFSLLTVPPDMYFKYKRADSVRKMADYLFPFGEPDDKGMNVASYMLRMSNYEWIERYSVHFSSMTEFPDTTLTFSKDEMFCSIPYGVSSVKRIENYCNGTNSLSNAEILVLPETVRFLDLKNTTFPKLKVVQVVPRFLPTGRVAIKMFDGSRPQLKTLEITPPGCFGIYKDYYNEAKDDTTPIDIISSGEGTILAPFTCSVTSIKCPVGGSFTVPRIGDKKC